MGVDSDSRRSTGDPAVLDEIEVLELISNHRWFPTVLQRHLVRGRVARVLQLEAGGGVVVVAVRPERSITGLGRVVGWHDARRQRVFLRRSVPAVISAGLGAIAAGQGTCGGGGDDRGGDQAAKVAPPAGAILGRAAVRGVGRVPWFHWIPPNLKYRTRSGMSYAHDKSFNTGRGSPLGERPRPPTMASPPPAKPQPPLHASGVSTST